MSIKIVCSSKFSADEFSSIEEEAEKLGVTPEEFVKIACLKLSKRHNQETK